MWFSVLCFFILIFSGSSAVIAETVEKRFLEFKNPTDSANNDTKTVELKW
tara:strand:- start:40 stop:189 length:150 start_codon:yes stop_codon:yes gene_type:complete